MALPGSQPAITPSSTCVGLAPGYNVSITSAMATPLPVARATGRTMSTLRLLNAACWLALVFVVGKLNRWRSKGRKFDLMLRMSFRSLKAPFFGPAGFIGSAGVLAELPP
jgi:hypothetical protein